MAGFQSQIDILYILRNHCETLDSWNLRLSSCFFAHELPCTQGFGSFFWIHEISKNPTKTWWSFIDTQKIPVWLIFTYIYHKGCSMIFHTITWILWDWSFRFWRSTSMSHWEGAPDDSWHSSSENHDVRPGDTMTWVFKRHVAIVYLVPCVIWHWHLT